MVSRERAIIIAEKRVQVSLILFRHLSLLPPTTECYVMEPLTAGTLECLALGVPTSYKRVMALTCKDLFLGKLTAQNESLSSTGVL